MKQAALSPWSMPTQPKGQSVPSFKVVKKLRVVLEQIPIFSRTDQLVGVQVDYSEKALLTQIKADEGVWDPASRLWKLLQRAARWLGLSDRLPVLKE